MASKLWLVCYLCLLYLVPLSTADGGDPSRIPTGDELAGLEYESQFQRWPDCASDCTDLQIAYNASIETWCSATIIGFCLETANLIRVPKFCSASEATQCPNSCTFGFDPRSLLSWVNSTCANDTQLLQSWSGFTLAKEQEWLSEWIPALLPWDWTVQAYSESAVPSSTGIQITDPLNSSTPFVHVAPSGPGTCPASTSEKLGVFAAVNVMSACLLPILGRRTFVNKVTFGIGGRLGSRGWTFLGILSAVMHLSSNFINAQIIRNTPGYGDVHVAALALLWCTRPRLSWLAVFLATREVEEGMYLNSAASAITSEAILQSLGAVYFGITANYGRKKGYYRIKHLDQYPRGISAHIMYAGALVWLMIFLFTLGACLASIIGINTVISNARSMMKEARRVAGAGANAIRVPMHNWIQRMPKWIQTRIEKRQARIQNQPEAPPRKLTESEIREIESVTAAVIIFMAFMAQWLFWAGFIRAAGERYCPPKLATLGTVWGIFSATGIFIGAAH